MDAIAKVVNWSIVLATVFWWAGVQGDTVINTQGLTIRREHALFVACVFFIFANFFALDTFYRIGGLLKNCNDDSFEKASAILALHPWIFNPFSLYGYSILSNFMTGKGYGLLIFIWWYGNSSLLALTDRKYVALGILMQAVFLTVGLLSMITINRVEIIIYKRFLKIDPDVAATLKRVTPIRLLVTLLGIGIGGLLYFGTMQVVLQ